MRVTPYSASSRRSMRPRQRGQVPLGDSGRGRRASPQHARPPAARRRAPGRGPPGRHRRRAPRPRRAARRPPRSMLVPRWRAGWPRSDARPGRRRPWRRPPGCRPMPAIADQARRGDGAPARAPPCAGCWRVRRTTPRHEGQDPADAGSGRRGPAAARVASAALPARCRPRPIASASGTGLWSGSPAKRLGRLHRLEVVAGCGGGQLGDLDDEQPVRAGCRRGSRRPAGGAPRPGRAASMTARP